MDSSLNPSTIPQQPNDLPQQQPLPQPEQPTQITPTPQTPSLSPVPQPANNPVYSQAQPQVFQPQIIQPQAQSAQQLIVPVNPSYVSQSERPTVIGGEMNNNVPIKKRKGKKLLILLPIVLILILAGVGYYFLAKPNPQSVFDKTLSNSLSTSQVEETESGSGSSADIKYNLANIQEPIISSSASLSVFGINYSLSGYGTRTNTFVEYTSIGVGQTTENNADTTPFLNKWIQDRVNGNLPSGGDDGVSQFVDPRYLLFGQYIFGNFTSSERQTLVNYVETNNVYQFNTKDVTSSTLNGNKVLIYPVSLNIAKLTTFNDKVAGMLNLSSSDVSNINQGISSGPQSATLYINPSTDQVLRVDATAQGATLTINYSNYNDLTLPAQPTPQLTWAQFSAESSQSD